MIMETSYEVFEVEGREIMLQEFSDFGGNKKDIEKGIIKEIKKIKNDSPFFEEEEIRDFKKMLKNKKHKITYSFIDTIIKDDIIINDIRVDNYVDLIPALKELYKRIGLKNIDHEGMIVVFIDNVPIFNWFDYSIETKIKVGYDYEELH